MTSKGVDASAYLRNISGNGRSIYSCKAAINRYPPITAAVIADCAAILGDNTIFQLQASFARYLNAAASIR